MHYPGFPVDYKPDAAPGPHDAEQLFDDFINLVDQRKKGRN